MQAPSPQAAFVRRPCASLGRAHGVPVALKEISLRCYSDPTVFLLRACHNAVPRRVLCACTKCTPSHGDLGDPTASNGDATEMLLRSRRPYGVHLGVLHFSWTP